MRKTRYTVKSTTQFKKDYKLAMKRGLKMGLLEDVVAALAMGEQLPEKNKAPEHIAIYSVNSKDQAAVIGEYSIRRFFKN